MRNDINSYEVNKLSIIKDEIRINNKYAHLYHSEYQATSEGESVPKINKKSLLTQDYLKRITNDFAVEGVSVLPPNCRYIEKVQQGHVVVIEEPPAYRTVRIRLDFKKEISKLEAEGKLKEYGYDKTFGRTASGDYKSESFTLALPYVIFALYITNEFQLSAGQIFFRVARLTGMGDYLHKAPFTNISDSQYICFGSQANGSGHSLNGAVEKIINAFWSAEFNTDYMYNYTAYTNVAGISTYMEWQALSRINPMFIYDVDWVKIPMNVGEAVLEMKRHYKLSSPSDIQYKSLSDIFSTPLDTGKDEKPTPRSRNKFRLFYDVASGIYLNDKFFVHVGDPFYIKHGKQLCYINSFISFIDASQIKYIRVERDDGRLITYKYTNALKDYLLKECKKLRYEETGVLKNGTVIKEDDILIMKSSMGNDLYKKVGFIRKSPDGHHEGRFGDGFYILENTEATVFDTSKPAYNGLLLEKDVRYIYLTSTSNVPWQNGSIVKFDKVDADTRGRLHIELSHTDTSVRTSPYHLRLESSSHNNNLFPMEKFKAMPPVFRNGRALKAVTRSDRLIREPVVYGSEDGIISDGNYNTRKPSAKEIKEFLLEDSKFHIQSFDLDIEFDIGDKVVVADWKNPVNMLSVKVIQGFKFDESDGSITFILADREGKLHQEKYVDGRYGIINVGRIRKITNAFGRLTAGTKIQAKEPYIPQFPMKDVNIIIGFITDTGGSDPLVLCSNCCTLWYSDVVSKFKKTTMKAKKWQTLQHAPIDISKVKFQAGDIIKSTGDYNNQMGWLVFRIAGTSSLKILDFKYYSSYPEYYTLDRYISSSSILDCIPNPRIAPKAQTEFGIGNGWPNLHGHFFSCKRSVFKFIKDERSMINVQSSPK